jgi:hypothetical protein
MLSAIAASRAVISGPIRAGRSNKPTLTPGDAARATGEPPARRWRRPPLSYPAAEPHLLTAPNSSATAATANPARLRQPTIPALTAPAPSRFPTPDPPPPRAWTGDRREPANRADRRLFARADKTQVALSERFPVSLRARLAGFTAADCLRGRGRGLAPSPWHLTLSAAEAGIQLKRGDA